MPSAELGRMVASHDTGYPTVDGGASTIVAAGGLRLGEALLATVTQEGSGTTTVDNGKDDTDDVPTSWSFAARQRSECARLARVFRYARHRMRQELRGLALDHAELLLGAVTRTVVTATRGSGGIPAVPSSTGTARGRRLRERPQMEGSAYNPEGEGDDLEEETRLAEGGSQAGGKCVARSSGRNLRHEARPQSVWNKRWAMAVDEDSMGELSTLALDEFMLEGDKDAGLEARAGVGADTLVEWRKAFRQRVFWTGASLDEKEHSANRRCESNIACSARNDFCVLHLPAPVALCRRLTADTDTRTHGVYKMCDNAACRWVVWKRRCYASSRQRDDSSKRSVCRTERRATGST